MSKLLDRLQDPARSGAYRASRAEDILDATRGSALDVARVDVADGPLFEALARQLGFPDWFGRNWDALEDCLTDLSWSKARGHVLLFENANSLADGDRKALMDVLDEAAAHWRATQRSFFAVFLGDAAGLPPLYRRRQ